MRAELPYFLNRVRAVIGLDPLPGTACASRANRSIDTLGCFTPLDARGHWTGHLDEQSDSEQETSP